MKARHIAILGVVILIIGALILQAGDGLPFLDKWLGNLNPLKPKPAIIAIGESIITDITQEKLLTTTIYSIQLSVEKRFDGTWLQAKSYRMVMVLKGSVEAGLDLDQFHSSDVSMSPDGKTIIVNLPPVKILTDSAHVLSNDSTETYVFFSNFQRNAAISQTDLEAQIRSEAGGSIIQTACNEGILANATTDAYNTVVRLMNTRETDLDIKVVSAPVPTTCP